MCWLMGINRVTWRGRRWRCLCRQIEILACTSKQPIVEITVDEKTVNDAGVVGLRWMRACSTRRALVHILPADGDEKDHLPSQGQPNYCRFAGASPPRAPSRCDPLA